MDKGEIFGHFIICGKPIFENGKINRWQPSFVKLSQIKTIHDDDGHCIFYTYKDEWYGVGELKFHELAQIVNEYMDSNDAEIV